MRLRVPLLWLALMLAGMAPTEARGEVRVEDVELSASPVGLHAEDPKQQRLGPLVWRGGIEITSPDERIGGLSGLLVSADGTELLAVSDKGRWLSARLRYDDQGRLVGLDGGRTAPLRGLDGAALATKKWRDAESLAVLEAGTKLVSFEREHRIWRYAASDGSLDAVPTAWPEPEDLGDVPGNGGLEALVALQDGDLLALTQDHFEGSDGVGYLWREERWWRLSYAREAGFAPTGATRLPGGDVLVVERGKQKKKRSIRLVRVGASDIRPGARLRGRELARWNEPLTLDDFEGIAARSTGRGETLVYLLSDDDFEEDQRTLLILFELHPVADL